MVRFVLTRIAQARRWAAESEHCGAPLTRALEAHRSLLPVICELTEEEADTIEPAFTEFEAFLFSLRGDPIANQL
jgi:hypothetical protein